MIVPPSQARVAHDKTNDALAFLERAIRAAASGGGLTPADTAALAQAIKTAASGGSIDEALGLGRHWRSSWRTRRATEIAVGRILITSQSLPTRLPTMIPSNGEEVLSE